MKKLLKKLLRDISRAKGQFIAVTLIFAIGTLFYTGLTVMHKSLKNAVDGFYEEYNLADLWLYYQGIDDDGIRSLEEINGIQFAEGRLKTSAVLKNGSGTTDEFTVHTLPNGAKTNVPQMETGSLPKASECIVDKAYAEANGIAAGDRLSTAIDGKDYSFTVSGTYISPEYIYIVKNIDDMIPDHEAFGVLYLNQSFVAEHLGAVQYNEVTVSVNEDANLQQLQKEAETKTAGYGFGYALGREKVVSYVMLDADTSQLEKMGLFFPYVFFLVAAVIIFISMSRRVESERGQIGIMKALGIRSSAIMLHFLGFAVMTAAAGCLVGSLIGVFVLPGAMLDTYNMFYTLPNVPPSDFWGNVLFAAGMSLLFGMTATVFSCHKTLKEIPAQAMRPKAPRKVKETIFEKNGFLWSRMSYGNKLIIRNIFSGKAKAVLSSVGVIACVGLIIASLAMNDAMRSLFDKQYNEISLYDISATLNIPADSGGSFEFEDKNIEGVYPQASTPASIRMDDEESNTKLNALPKNNAAVALFDENGNKLALPDDGVIITKYYADKYNLKTDDIITLRLTPLMQASLDIEVTVKSIGISYLSQDLYTSFEYLDRLGCNLPADSLLITVKDHDRLEDTAAALRDDGRVKTAVSKDETKNKLMETLSMMNVFIGVMILASAILALAVVFNISSINIFDRRRDIATLKVLGYHKKEVNRLVFTENLFITAFGSLFGIGFGFGIYYTLIKTMIPDGMMFPFEIKPMTVVISIALGFLFTIFANQLLRRRIGRIDMVESLKSVE